MINIRFIARENFNPKMYAALRITERDVQKATVSWGERERIDCARLAEVSKTPEYMIECQARIAAVPVEKIDLSLLTGIENAVLARLNETMQCLHLKAKSMIYWKRGLEGEDEKLKGKANTIYAALIEAMAEQAGVPVHALNKEHFYNIRIEGLSSNMSGLIQYLKFDPEKNDDIVSFTLKKLGLGSFDKLPLSMQLEALKHKESIHWDKLPLRTQRYLVRKLADTVGVNVSSLTGRHFYEVTLDEIGANLGGLLKHYQKYVWKGDGNIIRFMLRKMGIESLHGLSQERQLAALRCLDAIQWDRVPVSTQFYLVRKLGETVGVPVYALKADHFMGVELAEIGMNLSGLFNYYEIDPNRKESTIGHIFTKLGIESFSKLPFDAQIKEMKLRGRIPWDLIPLATQRYLVRKLSEKTGVAINELKEKHFHETKIDEIDHTLDGLVEYYRNNPRRKESTIRFIKSELELNRFGDMPVQKIKTEQLPLPSPSRLGFLD